MSAYSELVSLAKAKQKLDSIQQENEYKRFIYRLNGPQEAFFLSTAKRLGAISANRSGKTTVGCLKAVHLALGIHPTVYTPIPNIGWVCGEDFNAVNDYLIPTFFEYFPPSQIKEWDKRRYILTTKQNSKVHFKSYDQGYKKYASSKVHYVHLDEEPEIRIYKECTARVLDYDGIIMITVTPLQGLTYVYDDFWIPGHRNNIHDRVYATSMSTYDNPFYKDKKHVIDAWAAELSPVERAIRVFGQFKALTGRVLNNFSEDLNVIPPFDIPKSWTIFLGLDHGLNNPTALSCWGIGPRDNIFIFDEYYENELTISENVGNIKKIIGNFESQIADFVSDPYDLIKREPKKKDTLLQLYRREGLSFLRLGRRSDLQVRINKFKDLFNTTPERPSSKLKIFESCVKHIWEANRWTWPRYYLSDRERGEIGEQPKKKDDHLMKACTLLADLNPKFIPAKRPKKDDGYVPFMEKTGY